MKRKLLTFLIGIFLFLPPEGIQGQMSSPKQSDTKMILTQRSMVIVTINNVITNTCDGAAGLYSPEERELFSGYNDLRGQSVTLGPYEAGTELIFYLRPFSFCSGYTYLSTNILHAHVTPLEAPNSWRIDWEDLPDDYPPDNDFNDLILVVSSIGSVPDFKQDHPDAQGGWENNPYDNIPSTIGQVGCATTAAADLLHYYGAADVDPRTLDDCLSRDDVRGYVRWEDDPDCIDGRTKDCDIGAIYWDKVGWCSNPDNPFQQPYLMQWVEKVKTGDLITQSDLKRFAEEDLTNGWPVIFEVKHPDSPSGVHYLVGTGKQDSVFQVNDPFCGDPWPSCPSSRDTLDNFIELRAIVRFRPYDGIFRPTLIMNAFSPIEFYVADPQGRRTGYLPDGTYLAEIPDANYYFQPPIVDDQTGALMGDGFKQFYALNAVPGDYTVTVTGVGKGAYSLVAEYAAAPVAVQSASQSGAVIAGASQIYTLRVQASGSLEWILDENTFLPEPETEPPITTQDTASITDTPAAGDEPQGILVIPNTSQPRPGDGTGILIVLLVMAGIGVLIYSNWVRSRKSVVTATPTGHAFLIDPQGQRVTLTSSDVRIGRGSACQVRLWDRAVSREHALLRRVRGGWYLQDLGSAIGTLVNGKRVKAARLKRGDRITIGSVTWTFQE